MSRCSTCDAAIVWCRTSNGKSMPVDLEPVDDGNLVIVGGRAFVAGLLDPPGPRYVSHFATCPNASSHRKDR